MISPKKIFVSGCFDMMHSGHIAFLNEAARYGDVYVALGSDKTINELKGRETINSELERKYLIENLRSVKKCIINRGSGILDFLEEIDEIKPDLFIVNEDGNTPEKAELCRQKEIDYLVLSRIPYEGLPKRSTTDLRKVSTLPYRVDIAGTWIDQPYVSKYHPGSAIVASIEPTVEFFERSGMASSTRKNAKELWPTGLPFGKPEKLARQLFRYDNPPSKEQVSGSQDALGIVMPGVNKLFYNKGEYWPAKIETIEDEETLNWLEQHICFLTLWPRKDEFNVLDKQNLSTEGVKKLAMAAESCWDAIKNRDLDSFGKSFLDSFKSQTSLFPLMLNSEIEKYIDLYKNSILGWKLSGAGGGGYLIMVSEKPIQNTMKIKIRRRSI